MTRHKVFKWHLSVDYLIDCMVRGKKGIHGIGFAILFGFFFGFVITVAIFQWAWNKFVPTVFGLPEITFVMAFAAEILIGSVVGGIFSRVSLARKSQFPGTGKALACESGKPPVDGNCQG